MRYLSGIIALSLLVVLHELGHFVAARAFGIRVRRFSFGFGPPMFTLHRKTDWVLAAFPFGASVRFLGEDGPDAFVSQAWWKRLLVLASGPVLNFALAVWVLVALFLSGTHLPVKMTVGTVEPGSVAARAQLRPGDVIAQVNGANVEDWSEFVDAVQDNPDKELRLAVRRGAQTELVELVPRPDESGIGRIGISQQYVHKTLPFGEALSESFDYIGRLLRDGAGILGRIVRGTAGAELARPSSLVKQASDTAASGWDAFWRVFVHLSIALALFYLLPLPSLDGGRMLFAVIEAVRGKPVNRKLETVLHALGFLALLAMIGWIAATELRRPAPPAAAPAAPSEAAPELPDAGVDAGTSAG